MRDNVVIRPKELKPMIGNFIKTFFLPIKGFELIGFLLSLVPIINFVVFGYALQVVRKTFLSEDVSLPEWKNLKQMFIEGFKFFVFLLCIGLIPYAISIILLLIPSMIKFTSEYSALTASISLLFANYSLFILFGYLTPALIVLFAVQGWKKMKLLNAFKLAFSIRYLLTFILSIIFIWIITSAFMIIRTYYGAAGAYFVGRDLIPLALITWWIMIMSSALFGLAVDNKHKSLIVAGFFANGKKKKK